jgi:outer membrane autotransporter protein
LGYEARLWGFSGGYEHYFGNTLLGLHLGYGHSDIDYTGAGFGGNSEEQDVVTGGFNGLTRWEPWILHYGVTGFYGDHDYEGLTGFALADQETASCHSYGTGAMLMAGHIFRWGPHVFLPEAGFNWLWVHRPRYTTEATDPNWDTTYSPLDEHDVYAAAALQWLSTFVHDGIHVTPAVGVGVRYLLTDDETSAQLSVPGAAPVVVKSEQDRTALTLSGSLTLTKAPHALSLSYDGDYFPDVQRHSVWLRYTWLF